MYKLFTIAGILWLLVLLAALAGWAMNLLRRRLGHHR